MEALKQGRGYSEANPFGIGHMYSTSHNLAKDWNSAIEATQGLQFPGFEAGLPDLPQASSALPPRFPGSSPRTLVSPRTPTPTQAVPLSPVTGMAPWNPEVPPMTTKQLQEMVASVGEIPMPKAMKDFALGQGEVLTPRIGESYRNVVGPAYAEHLNSLPVNGPAPNEVPPAILRRLLAGGGLRPSNIQLPLTPPAASGLGRTELLAAAAGGGLGGAAASMANAYRE